MLSRATAAGEALPLSLLHAELLGGSHRSFVLSPYSLNLPICQLNYHFQVDFLKYILLIYDILKENIKISYS